MEQTNEEILEDGQSYNDEHYDSRRDEEITDEECEENLKEILMDNLTELQEDKLKQEHAQHYTGTDDEMPDAYENWLYKLSSEEIKSIIN